MVQDVSLHCWPEGIWWWDVETVTFNHCFCCGLTVISEDLLRLIRHFKVWDVLWDDGDVAKVYFLMNKNESVLPISKEQMSGKVLEDCLFYREYLSRATSAASFQQLNKKAYLQEISNSTFTFVSSHFRKPFAWKLYLRSFSCTAVKFKIIRKAEIKTFMPIMLMTSKFFLKNPVSLGNITATANSMRTSMWNHFKLLSLGSWSVSRKWPSDSVHVLPL